MNEIKIPLDEGKFLVAERDNESPFNREIYLSIKDKDGIVLQDLAIVRNAFTINETDQIEWLPHLFEIMVYADKDNEDYTNKFVIAEHEENN